MQVIKNKSKMHQLSRGLRAQGHSIAFVPTMGFLHKGHLSLIRKAKETGDVTLVSIYVNPTQFGPGEDFNKYPRDMDRDINLLENEGVHALFAPDNLYDDNAGIEVDPGPMQHVLCGKSRPGHFKSVATVVAKLFNIIEPDYAVFGQKDAQQFIILSKMVKDLDIPVKMVMSPIIREPDGLAMSSRNKYLSKDERALAPSLFESLEFIENAFQAGKRDAKTVLQAAQQILKGELEYLSAVNQTDLKPSAILEKGVLIAGAIRLGSTRLIDNIIL